MQRQSMNNRRPLVLDQNFGLSSRVFKAVFSCLPFFMFALLGHVQDASALGKENARRTVESATDSTNLKRGYELLLEADRLSKTGTVGEVLSKLEEALPYFQEDNRGLSRYHSKKGEALVDHRLFSEALKELLLAQDLTIESEDSLQYANNLVTLGYLYRERQNFAKSREYFEKAFKIYQVSGDLKGQFDALVQLAGAASLASNFAQARIFLENALDVANAMDGFRQEPYFFNLAAKIECGNANFSRAELFANRAQTLIYAGPTDSSQLCINQKILGFIAFSKGNYGEATEYYERALKIAELRLWNAMVAELHLSLAKVSEIKGDPRLALAHMKVRDSLVVDLHRADNSQDISSAAVAFSTSKAQTALAISQARVAGRNRLLLVMVGVILVVGLLSILLWDLFRQRSRLSKELEKKIAVATKTNSMLESQQNDLAASIAVRERLFSVLSHDLRSPVATLRGLLQLLEMQADSLSPADIRHLTSYTGQNLENLSSMLDGLLEWTQAQRGKVVEAPMAIEPEAFFHKLKTNLEPSLSRKSLNLNLTNALSDRWIHADPSLLEIIVRNLLTNAVKFSFEGRNIMVWFYQEPRSKDVIIRVGDSGIGMTPERVKNLFQKKWQLSERGTHGEKGAGVGLALCCEFATLCRWSLLAYSTLGRGSSIYLRMPKAAIVPADQSTQQPSISAGFPKRLQSEVEGGTASTVFQTRS